MVLETIGSIDEFQRAVRGIGGMEWLAEWDQEFPPDDDFYKDEDDHESLLGGMIFLIMTNQSALTWLLILWQRYKETKGRAVHRNFGPWRHVFQQLRDIRFWDTPDRLRDTGLLENLHFELESGSETVRIEAELWFEHVATERQRRSTQFANRVAADGGRVLSECVIAGAAYHGVLFELPSSAARELLDGRYDLGLAVDSSVMFFRPVGQTAVPVSDEDPLAGAPLTAEPVSLTTDPVVALLDGLPLANHQWLSGRLIIDDPDAWEGSYLAHARAHGTAMASLIIHGDANNAQEALRRPIYARPILRPRTRYDGQLEENIPDDLLPLDLIHRAFHRMFEGDGTEQAVAPTVRIVNFSIGDVDRPFDRSMSSWGRVFDWLAWRYNVLILVSAGNCLDDIELDISRADLNRIEPHELEQKVIGTIAATARNRRLLVPGEAVNVLTIGSSHEDGSSSNIEDDRIDCYRSLGLPSPINRVGLGYRRAVKPDVLLPGGRQLFRAKITSNNQPAVLQPVRTEAMPPGQVVAAPSRNAGELSGRLFRRGTSNATALASRAAAQLYEELNSIQLEPGGDALLPECIPAILKALIVHSASWTEGQDNLTAGVAKRSAPSNPREYAARFLGYGSVDVNRALHSTDQRPTIVGCGVFDADGSHQFLLPLPPSLRGLQAWKRLTATLAWLTPTNPNRQTYRVAALTLTPGAQELRKALGLSTCDVDSRAVARGTVQHQVFEGRAAREFEEDSDLVFQVNCREEAGILSGRRVPYGIVISLEVAEELELPLYDEVLVRIRQPIRV